MTALQNATPATLKEICGGRGGRVAELDQDPFQITPRLSKQSVRQQWCHSMLCLWLAKTCPGSCTWCPTLHNCRR